MRALYRARRSWQELRRVLCAGQQISPDSMGNPPHGRPCSKGNDDASLTGRLIVNQAVPNLVLRRLIIDDMNGLSAC
ncbi:uncharacterized protein EpC_22030 [Erwinia pyrifoliae Ep1/96]|nr:uncharacterized protein EpC_22030 [Erwinia pyrifoliae Ep1/96]